MNWCAEHWDMLKAKIDAKGLGGFVAKSGQELVQNIRQEMATDDSIFEPLMGCWSRINSVMLQSRGLNGRVLHCPLCTLVEDGQPHLVESWLEGATTEALNYAVEQKLMPPKEPSDA